ncbi:MAG TPA: cupin domain-containing protein [Baekduia sp.]|nr:cupin domain-containing protein [Baekduia sp.]
MNTYQYPHTIENGGERLTFVRRIEDGTGDRLEVENVVKPGFGPPMHVHHRQVESLTVAEGRIGYQRLGEEPQFAGPGESVTFQAGEVHRFWNAGDGELRCKGHIQPADNIEYFLGAMYDSQRESGSMRPGVFDAAFLMRRFRSEFAMTEIPAPVQRFVFPLQVLIGHLLGKYRKYADAPAPIAR